MKRNIADNPEQANIQISRYAKMKKLYTFGSCASLLAMLMLPAPHARAAAFVQCPGDTDGDAVIDTPDAAHPNAVCRHLSSGDGYTNMADGYLQYAFGFGELTGIPLQDSHDVGILNASFTAPTITLKQGDEFYLTLSNNGMIERPDLFDAHTVHFHGFPNASSVFDGVPDASIAINMGASLTYYYNIVEPGTYLYHCHVEAAEHMQMGMQGNLYVHPAQDDNYASFSDLANGIDYSNGVPDPDGSGRLYTRFAYNDILNGDPGSTGYDVEFPLMLTGFDHEFHDASLNTQPLPFAEMRDTYHMFNGRGYPITVEADDFYANNPGPAQAIIAERMAGMMASNPPDLGNEELNGRYYKQNFNTQPYGSRIEVSQGQKLLLRITNLSITRFHTITALGLPMHVIGQGGRELKDKYSTASVNLGGGESFDVVIDTLNIQPGTYYVYTNELHQLSNNQQSFGGAMTEIVVSAAAQ
jgi:FtsP/CotA-like multicopper oxidase with cupredoxin domain